MTEEYKPLSPEEIERIKTRLAIAGPPDRSRNATAMDWYALDVGRLLATIAAKEAENAELRRELAAKDTTSHRYKTPAVRAYPVELEIIDGASLVEPQGEEEKP